VQIYTNSKAGEKVKSAAQGLITLATYGVGMLSGCYIAGKITAAHVVDQGHDWTAIWQLPALFAVAVFVIFALFFKNESIDYKE
jgi:MFS family permease